MEIIIEIGTKEQKKLIREELFIIEQLLDQIDLDLNITKLIIPSNFESKINQLLGITSYKAIRRSQAAYARTLFLRDGISLVFSPFLYTIEFDYHIRLSFYLHEFFHAFNKVRFPQLLALQKAEDIYLTIIYALFDEYYALRKSFETLATLNELSFIFKRCNYVYFKRHIDLIISREYFYELQYEIRKFRCHGNVDYFLNKTKILTDEISKALINIFSYLDSCRKLKRIEPFLSRSVFVNDATLNLIDYFREKYKNCEIDLTDGIPLIEMFICNFGIKFEDIPEGIYCNVLDI